MENMSVISVDDNRNTSQPSSQSAQSTSLGGMRVNNRGTHAAQIPENLPKGEKIGKGDFARHFLQPQQVAIRREEITHITLSGSQAPGNQMGFENREQPFMEHA